VLELSNPTSEVIALSTASKRRYTEAEYLAIERDVETKHEYYRGEMFAMSGASRQHNRITVNVSAFLHEQLKNRKCEHFTNDMRVKVESTALYTYPDVVVTCHEPRFLDKEVDTLAFESSSDYQSALRFHGKVRPREEV
jgi:Uma2 family endonuclease